MNTVKRELLTPQEAVETVARLYERYPRAGYGTCVTVRPDGLFRTVVAQWWGAD